MKEFNNNKFPTKAEYEQLSGSAITATPSQIRSWFQRKYVFQSTVPRNALTLANIRRRATKDQRNSHERADEKRRRGPCSKVNDAPPRSNDSLLERNAACRSKEPEDDYRQKRFVGWLESLNLGVPKNSEAKAVQVRKVQPPGWEDEWSDFFELNAR